MTSIWEKESIGVGNDEGHSESERTAAYSSGYDIPRR